MRAVIHRWFPPPSNARRSRGDGIALTTALLLARCVGVPSPTVADAGADVRAADDAQGPLGAGTCAQATPVGDGTARAAETLDGAGRNAGCLGALRSVAYRVTVPPGRVLTVSAAAADGPVVLQVLDGCDASACLAQSSTAGVAPLFARWHNAGRVSREVRVLAGSFSEWSGRFAISFSLAAAPTNISCDAAEALDDGAWRGEQRFGPSAEVSALCTDRQAPAAAGLRWYRVELPARSSAVATITPGPTAPGREFGVAAVMRSDCSATTCSAATPVLLRARGSLVGANDTDSPRAVLLGVGVYPPQAEGTYSLALALRPRDEAARCEGAAALADSVEARGDTSLSAAVAPLCGTESVGGPVRFHRVAVPPGRFLELRAATTSNRALALRSLISCADLRCAVDGSAETSPVLRVPNLSDTTLPVTVAVGARDPDARVPYTLLARFVPPDAAGRCPGAEPFNARTGTLSTHYVADAGPRCGAEAMGPARWLRLQVPANTAVRLTATSPAVEGVNTPVAIRVLETCDDARCLASGTGQTVWANTAETTREVLVAVGLATPGARGAVTLFAVPQPLAPNSFCARATSVSAGAPAQREMGGQSLASAAWCGGAPRLSRWYATTVPAGEVLHAWARNPFGVFSTGMPALALRPSCEADCEAESAPPGARGSHLWWRNHARTARPVWIQAGWEALSGSYYDLAVETFAPELQRCTEADALPAAISVDRVRGEAEATACAPMNRGPVRWFRATVGAGRTLALTATVAATSPPAPVQLGVHDGCEGACLAQTTGASTLTTSWRNDGPNARELRVSLHAADGATLPAVTLNATER